MAPSFRIQYCFLWSSGMICLVIEAWGFPNLLRHPPELFVHTTVAKITLLPHASSITQRNCIDEETSRATRGSLQGQVLKSQTIFMERSLIL